MTRPDISNEQDVDSLDHVGRRILVVEDDDGIAVPLLRTLDREGYDVERVADGATALERAGDDIDLVVLDLGLPDMDGLDVCRRLREQDFAGGIIILTARDGELDRVVGLDVGADDYIAKPFALAELLARLRALLRRTQRPGGDVDDDDEALAFEDLRLDPGTRDVTRGERPLRLTRTEFSLLEMFMHHPRRVLTRAFILEEVWGFDFPTTANSLEVYVGYLRRKTEEAGESRLIHTVRGVGYVLRETPP
jgi:two-component system response regulator MprA